MCALLFHIYMDNYSTDLKGVSGGKCNNNNNISEHNSLFFCISKIICILEYLVSAELVFMDLDSCQELNTYFHER
jgi:hypothetical protein